MLVSDLYIAGVWFLLTFFPLVFFGHRFKIGNAIFAVIWLFLIIIVGNYILPGNWIIVLPDWNVLAKVSWSSMLLLALLYLTYAFRVTAFATANVVGFTLSLIFFTIE